MKRKFKSIMYSWTITDDHILYGGLIKKKILLKDIKDITFSRADRPKKAGEWTLGHITLYRLSPEENTVHTSKLTGNNVHEDEGILLSFRNDMEDEAKETVYYIIEHSGISEKRKAEMVKSKLRNITNISIAPGSFEKPVNKNEHKDASVVGRAVVGGIIAGPTGAVVGALSAVDKNNKNKE